MNNPDKPTFGDLNSNSPSPNPTEADESLLAFLKDNEPKQTSASERSLQFERFDLTGNERDVPPYGFYKRKLSNGYQRFLLFVVVVTMVLPKIINSMSTAPPQSNAAVHVPSAPNAESTTPPTSTEAHRPSAPQIRPENDEDFKKGLEVLQEVMKRRAAKAKKNETSDPNTTDERPQNESPAGNANENREP